MSATEVRVPSQAVAGDDISVPTQTLLRDLSLLPTRDELSRAAGFTSAFSGPPDSVALIEAGATAASKWWAAGLGGAAIAAWAAVRAWWGTTESGNQHVALWAAAIVTSACILGIAYLLGSDVRGRAAVAAETVRARAKVAEAFVRMAEQAYAGTAGRPQGGGLLQLASLPPLTVENIRKSGSDEAGWRALAVLTDGDNRVQYLVVKAGVHEWVDSEWIKVP
jgi:hypothetical protein